MRITWSGTGSAWSPSYGNSSALLEVQSHRLLFDCGHTVPGRLRQMGVSLREIQAVFISHLHGDHIYGLEEWGFRNRLIWNTRPRLLIAEELARPLWENVLSGTMGRIGSETFTLENYFEVTPLHTDEPCSFGPWTLAIHPVRHVPAVPAYGLRVRAGSATVAFTGDSVADALPWFYEDAAAVFHDCSFYPPREGSVHAHFEQLARYPASFRERTYLVHYDDSIEQQRQGPEWQAMISATGMRLADPFVSLEF